MDAPPKRQSTIAKPVKNEESPMPSVTESLRRHLPAHQVITDELRRLAYGTDASFYRLVPEVIAVAENEEEVQAISRELALLAVGTHGQKVVRPLQRRGRGTERHHGTARRRTSGTASQQAS